MPDPSLMLCCGAPRVWHVHKADCPMRLRAMERRKNAHRALRQDQETRRAGVLEERPPGVVPLRARNAQCPVHPGELMETCAYCADLEVDG
jgi:hypothetical protein